MLTCRICLRDVQALAFNTKDVAICRSCVDGLNAAPMLGVIAEIRLGELLRVEMAKRNPEYTQEEFEKELPNWLDSELRKPENDSLEFRAFRAHLSRLFRKDGGKRSDYSPSWEKKARAIRKRDKHQCQNCHASDVMLDVHHIVHLFPFGTSWNANLVTLCRSCHEEAHGRVFDLGEAKEPGNPNPIQPKSGLRTTKLSLPAAQSTPTKPRMPVTQPMPSKYAGSPEKVEYTPVQIAQATPPRQPLAVTQATPSMYDGSSEKVEYTPVQVAHAMTLKHPLPTTQPTPIKATRPDTHIAIWLAMLVLVGLLIFFTTERPKTFEPYVAPPLVTLKHTIAPKIAPEISTSCTVVPIAASASRKPSKVRTAAASTKEIEQELECIMDAALQRYLYLNTEDGLGALREMIQLREKLLAEGHSPQESLKMAIETVAPLRAPRSGKRSE